VQNKLEGLGTF